MLISETLFYMHKSEYSLIDWEFDVQTIYQVWDVYKNGSRVVSERYPSGSKSVIEII